MSKLANGLADFTQRNGALTLRFEYRNTEMDSEGGTEMEYLGEGLDFYSIESDPKNGTLLKYSFIWIEGYAIMMHCTDGIQMAHFETEFGFGSREIGGKKYLILTGAFCAAIDYHIDINHMEDQILFDWLTLKGAYKADHDGLK